MRKTKRGIKNELEELKGDSVGDVTFHSSVVTFTDDTDEIEPEPPEGYTLGDKLPTQSPVVVWHELEPTPEP